MSAATPMLPPTLGCDGRHHYESRDAAKTAARTQRRRIGGHWFADMCPTHPGMYLTRGEPNSARSRREPKRATRRRNALLHAGAFAMEG